MQMYLNSLMVLHVHKEKTDASDLTSIGKEVVAPECLNNFNYTIKVATNIVHVQLPFSFSIPYK